MGGTKGSGGYEPEENDPPQESSKGSLNLLHSSA
jgi:hypothetical protein